jgi:hypothetical protein
LAVGFPLSPADQRTDPAPIGFVPVGGALVARARDLSAVLAPGSVVLATVGGAVELEFPGADPEASAEGELPLATRVNYLVGDDPAEWRTGLPVFSRARYRGLYPGIDMVYGSSARHLKSEFVVAPGADPSSIRMRYAGGPPPVIDAEGSLVVHTEAGEIRESPPVVFQEVDGERVPVSARYLLDGDRVGFEIGDYDRGRTLWIDPDITYSGFFGGTRLDTATAVATGPESEAIVAGWTDSPDLPGRWLLYHSGGVDAFVAKVPAGGGSPLWVTYFGGSGEDKAFGAAVDSAGNVWVVGTTTSANLPRVSPAQAFRRGTRDAFVANIHATGQVLRFSTYLGGSQSETATAARVDSGGNLYVAGDTNSTNFPTLSPYQRSLGGGRDGFVARFDPAFALTGATYLGGTGDDRITSLALAGNSVVVGGSTNSTNFPTASASQGTNGGGHDGFVSALAASLGGLVFSTYLGGSGGTASSGECVNAVASDAAGNIYAAGNTPSTNFPTTVPFQTAHGGGGQDGFVAKFAGTGLRVYSSHLGGRGLDQALGLAVDSAQRPWVVGYTSSNNFPTAAPLQAAPGGGYDMFATRLESSGATIGFSTYLGGTGSDMAVGAAVAASGEVVVVGSTGSPNFPIRNSTVAYRGSTDSVLVRLSPQ